MMNRWSWPARMAAAVVLIGLIVAGQHALVSKLTDVMTQHMLDILAHHS
jgi:hypothetical protein